MLVEIPWQLSFSTWVTQEVLPDERVHNTTLNDPPPPPPPLPMELKTRDTPSHHHHHQLGNQCRAWGLDSTLGYWDDQEREIEMCEEGWYCWSPQVRAQSSPVSMTTWWWGGIDQTAGPLTPPSQPPTSPLSRLSRTTNFRIKNKLKQKLAKHFSLQNDPEYCGLNVFFLCFVVFFKTCRPARVPVLSTGLVAFLGYLLTISPRPQWGMIAMISIRTFYHPHLVSLPGWEVTGEASIKTSADLSWLVLACLLLLSPAIKYWPPGWLQRIQ